VPGCAKQAGAAYKDGAHSVVDRRRRQHAIVLTLRELTVEPAARDRKFALQRGVPRRKGFKRVASVEPGPFASGRWKLLSSGGSIRANADSIISTAALGRLPDRAMFPKRALWPRTLDRKPPEVQST